MDNRPQKLSALFVERVMRPGRYGEGRGGNGLSLLVRTRANGGLAKTWAQRMRIYGRICNLGLGRYPIVTLARAREKAVENWQLLDEGYDPRHKPDEIPTLEKAMDEVIAIHRAGWKSGAREERIWRSSFGRYILPRLGNHFVSEISPADVLAVLRPLWDEKLEIGRRIRIRLSVVMKWCIAKGYRYDNPAGAAITVALPRQRRQKRHYRALHYTQAAAALEAVRESQAYLATKLAFEFLVLNASRSAEVRFAAWSEIDFDRATWSLPAERMKSNRAHRVPLSKQAIAILNQAKELYRGKGIIFPSMIKGKSISDATFSKLIRELGIPAVPHGFRSTFRDWASENTNAPRAVMEAALAHKTGGAVEQAYARSDLFDKRKVLMQAWADYLDTEESSHVIPIRRERKAA